ncbi:MAG: DUF1684 domain-containing protein [Candidatus Kapabacteria bacterium]|jgi:hypothetical protein|nr:DUF1684 domain-containing protein [Candidatus Kapabacteria bacterium]
MTAFFLDSFFRRSADILVCAVCVCSIFVVAACERQNKPQSSINPYFKPDTILLERKEKDTYWREGEASPLKAEDKALFQGLTYFAPNERYCVEARFEALLQQDTVRLQTSDNELRTMLRAGYFYFRIGEDSCRLTAFRYTGVEGKMQHGYFVPFKDATNGTDTYRPGRYIDVAVPLGNTPYILDFNRAFNPYCNYNEDYSCPLVPQENILAVRIEAGEKVFFHPRK